LPQLIDQRRRPLYDPEHARKKTVGRKKMGNFIKLKATGTLGA
jgi:hypothetical protein